GHADAVDAVVHVGDHPTGQAQRRVGHRRGVEADQTGSLRFGKACFAMLHGDPPATVDGHGPHARCTDVDYDDTHRRARASETIAPTSPAAAAIMANRGTATHVIS